MDPAFGQMNLHLDLLKPDSKVLGKLQSHQKASKCVSICKVFLYHHPKKRASTMFHPPKPTCSLESSFSGDGEYARTKLEMSLIMTA